MQNLLNSYTQTSTIAGLHYAFEPKQSLFGRITWFVSIAILTFLGAYLSLQNYAQWMEEPVLTTISSTGNTDKHLNIVCLEIALTNRI